MAGEIERNSRADDWFIPLTSDSLHDLASPINQIGTIGDLIVRKYRGALDNDAETLFGMLQNAMDRLQNLLTGLRTFAQVASSSEAWRLCEGNALLDAALAMLREDIAQEEALITHDELPAMWGNPAQLAYALASMLENSIKFRGVEKVKIHVSIRPDSDVWIICVQDNGMGIDPRHGERVFRTFKRLNGEKFTGAGMGLAITRHIAERHGGSVRFESQPGQGAAFLLSLPKQAVTAQSAG
jgi:light-regulated signal transduction histidine kinase (bacteriophytochrome)